MGLFSGLNNSSILGDSFNILNSISGVSQINNGADISVQGANLQASQYRTASAATKAQANYNIAVSKLNFNRQLSLISRDISRTLSSQKAAAASTGFSVSSQSFLEVANETLSTFERETIKMKNTQLQREREIQFEADKQRARLENQARGAEFQGQVARYNAELERSKAIGSIFNQGVSLLGSLF